MVRREQLGCRVIDQILRSLLQLTDAVIVMEMYWGSGAAAEPFSIGPSYPTKAHIHKHIPVEFTISYTCKIYLLYSV